MIKKKIHLSCLIILLIVLFLSSCGGGAAPEEPAAPSSGPETTKEQLQNIFGFGVEAAEMFYKTCSPSDYFMSESSDKMFLKLDADYNVCNIPDDESVSSDFTDVDKVFVSLVCDFSYHETKTFEEMVGDHLDTDELGVSACMHRSIPGREGMPGSVLVEYPVEYYECRENVYIYKDVSDKADCKDGVIEYFKPWNQIIEESACSEIGDYRYIERPLDGIFSEPTAFLVLNDDMVCDPTPETRELIDISEFCNAGTLTEVDTEFGYCIFPDSTADDIYKIPAKPYLCRVRLPGEDHIRDLTILKPYTEEQVLYLPWYCDFDVGSPSKEVFERDLIYYYSDLFPDNCHDYFDYNAWPYIVIKQVDGKICDIFTDQLKSWDEICANSFETDPDKLTCVVDQTLWKISSCDLKLGETGFIMKDAFVRIPMSDEELRKSSWKCAGISSPIQKNMIDYFDQYESCEGYYSYNLQNGNGPIDLLMYMKNQDGESKMCCPKDGVLKIPQLCCEDFDFSIGPMIGCEGEDEVYEFSCLVRFNDKTEYRKLLREIVDEKSVLFKCREVDLSGRYSPLPKTFKELYDDSPCASMYHTPCLNEDEENKDNDCPVLFLEEVCNPFTGNKESLTDFCSVSLEDKIEDCITDIEIYRYPCEFEQPDDNLIFHTNIDVIEFVETGFVCSYEQGKWSVS
ncbi:MAG: hypothetical protein KKF44_04715 [Nanoarchaeota archaeon]|nr:hypothetical protein [Nanoarchaeota archaeon]